MSNTFVWIIALIGTVTSVQYTLADTVTSESIRSTVYPYRTEVVRYQGITSGTTIGQQNWQVAEKALPAESARLVQAGDLGIVVQETTDGGYKVQSYRGGRPFPVIDPTDPRAGEKVARNYRYCDMPDSMEMRGTMQRVNNAGTIDRYAVVRAEG